MGRVRIAVVGCGQITSYRHLPAIVSEVPELELAALCSDRADGGVHLLGERYHVPTASRYTDYQSLFDRSDIDAILIAVSPAMNFEIIHGAAKARKHLFVEKPMAETVEQARIMVRLVEQTAIKFQVGFNKRYYYGYREAKKLITEERIGDPTGISARFWFKRSKPSPSKRVISARKQVVVQNGIHFLDLLQFFMGPACEVLAQERTVEDSNAGDRATVTATIAFQKGGVGSLLLSSCASWSYPNERLDVVGSNGCCISTENGRIVDLFVADEPGLHFEETISGHWLTGHKEAGFTSQLQAFAESILNDVPTEVGVEDGLRSVLLADAIEKSLETHQPTTVPRA